MHDFLRRGWLVALLIPLLLLQGALRAGGGASSPLLNIDPKLIPPLERFDWQPKELVGVLGEHRGRQGSPALCVAVSPDGKHVASGGSNGHIRIWDRPTMRLQTLVGHGGAVPAVAYSIDGTLLVSCGHEGAVRVWTMEKGLPVAGPYLQDASSALYAVGISPNNTYIAGAGADTGIYMWARDDKGQPKKLGHMQGHTGPVSSLAFAPDNKTMASGSHDGTVRFWNLGEKVRERSKFQAAAKEVRCITYSADGGLLATGDSEGTWRLWNLTGTAPTVSANVPTKYGAVTSIAFGPRGSKTLATGHADNTARLWSLATKPPREKPAATGHASTVNSVAFVPNSAARATHLVTASSDWTARVWDLAGTGKPVDRTVGMLNPGPPQTLSAKGHLSHVYTVDFSSDGKTLASGAADAGIRLWDVGGERPRVSYYYTKTPIIVYHLAYAPDGKTMAYGGADTNVYYWDPARKWQIHRFTGHPSHVGNLIFSPDGKGLLTCSAKTLHLFDVDTSKEERVFKGHITNVSCVAFSNDGKRVLSGSGAVKYVNGQPVIVNGRHVYEDCTVRLWDADSGKELLALKDHDIPILSMTFSRDGRRLYYGMQEPLIRQFELKDDKPGPMTLLKGTGGYVYTITTSPDGTLMATVGLDGQVILWDAVKNTRLRQWTMHEVCYKAVFSRDSRHLALPLGTGVIYLLRLDQGSSSRPLLAPSKK